MTLKCTNCSEETNSIGIRNLADVGRANTNSSGGISVDSGELTGLVDTIVPNIDRDGKDLKKEWWRYRNPFVRTIEEDTNRPTLELLKKFVRTTTGHGFARIVDPHEHWHLRIFWAMMVIFLAAGLLTSVSLISYEALVLRGLQREFIVQHNNTMFLPDIHICDTSLFSLSALEAMGFNKTMGSYLALTLSPMLASRSLRKNLKRRELLEKVYDKLMENRTIHEVYERATLKCENIILGCTHDVMSYNSIQCCHKIFGNRTYVTDLATMCVSTAQQPQLEEIFASQIYGLTVYLKTNTRDRFEFDSTIVNSNVASRRGLLYAVSDPITAVNPIISAAGHYMAPGKWAGVSISFTRTDNSELATGWLSPYSCVPSGSTSHLHLVPNYDVYSERNCIFASARIVLERKFNCTIFRFRKTRHYDNGTPCCDPDIMIGAYSVNLAQKIKKQSTGCPVDCIFNDYHLYSTPSQLHLGDQDEFLEGEKHGDHIVHSAIHFFYPSFSYTVIKNHPQRLVKWLSDVGSNMSLYLGASFVTLLEVVVLILRCARYITTKYKN